MRDDNYWSNERADVLHRFGAMLEGATGDGSKKRQAGTKPPWWLDDDHERAIFSHLTKWKAGEKADDHSGQHPLVHAAWRCLAIAARETYNTPDVTGWTTPMRWAQAPDDDAPSSKTVYMLSYAPWTWELTPPGATSTS